MQSETSWALMVKSSSTVGLRPGRYLLQALMPRTARAFAQRLADGMTTDGRAGSVKENSQDVVEVFQVAEEHNCAVGQSFSTCLDTRVAFMSSKASARTCLFGVCLRKLIAGCQGFRV